MCIALIAHALRPDFPLIIAANRDEYHARPTAPAAWWPEGILAGRDLSAGGTWFGIHRSGRVALLTNYRDGTARDPSRRSRGELPVTALLSQRSPHRMLADMLTSGEDYHGYNLVAGTPGALYCASNRNWTVQRIERGVAGLSNRFLDTPWPKVERAKARLREAVTAPGIAPESLFEVLRDNEQAADHELPDTGIGVERERALSSPFIIGEQYGTRSSTLLLVALTGVALFIERTFDPAGNPVGEVRQQFEFQPGAGD